MTRYPLPVTCLALLVACGSSSSSPSENQAIVVKHGAVLSDTAAAQHAWTVHLTGAPARIALQMESDNASFGGPFADDQFVGYTNASGDVPVTVTFGRRAGDALVRMSAPYLGLSGSIHLTVLPASLWTFGVAPEDTALIIGQSAAVTVYTADAYGNPRQGDPFSLRSLDSVLSVTGHTIRAERPGNGLVEVSVGALRGNLQASAVPLGMLTHVGYGRIETVRTDGVLQQAYPFPFGTPGPGQRFSWTPDGKTLVFDASGDLFLLNASGSFVTLPTNGEAASGPTITADGQWIYYARQVLPAVKWRIHRMARDGSHDEEILADSADLGWPTISPDGTQLAYVRGPGLWVYDLGSATARWLHAGTGPAWSANGRSLAFMARDTGGLWIINADGSGLRRVTTTNFDPGIEWSPDGKWFAVRSAGVQLVEVATGVRMRLPFAATWGALTWRP